MEQQTFKVRVDCGLTMDIDVSSLPEDEAERAAESIAADIIKEMVHAYEEKRDPDVYFSGWGVRAVDVEPVDYEKGE